MIARMEFDSTTKVGRSEDNTNDLRVKAGKLQQKFIVAVINEGQPMQVTEEWRDIPEEP